MKIVFVATHVWPAVGGTESFLHHLARELGDEHDVHVISLSAANEPSSRLRESLLPPPRFEAFSDGPATVEQLRLSRLARAALLPLVGQVLPGLRRYAWSPALRSTYASLYARVVAPIIAERAHGADVLHHWGSGLLGSATASAARQLGVPAAITPFVHPGQWGDDPVAVATYRKYDAAFALLDVEARGYRAWGMRNVAVAGVCSAPLNGPDGADLRHARRIDGPLVLFLGERRSYKGYDLLAAAAAHVPQATFAFVGAGPSVSGPNIVDAGRVDDEERAAWLAAADLLCLPSEAEILPVSILEAWSVGTPFLSSDIPPLRELAGGGGGWVVPRTVDQLAERLTELVAAPELLRAAGVEGRTIWQDRYTPRAVAAAYASEYAALAETPEFACAI